MPGHAFLWAELTTKDFEGLDPAPLKCGDHRCPRRRQFVEAGAMDDPGAFAAEASEYLSHRSDPFRREHAD